LQHLGLRNLADGEYIYTTATCGTPILHVALPRSISPGAASATTPRGSVSLKKTKSTRLDEKRQPYVQIDWVGAWTAAAGATIYDGGAWPAKWALTSITRFS